MFTKALFKPHCFLCSSHEGSKLGLCKACLNDLPWHNTMQCPQCALQSNGLTCGSCLNAPTHFDATQALFTYDFPIDSLLQHYKYKDMLQLADTFANLLSNKKLSSPNLSRKIDLIIPMPMHHARLKERGFNQALEIARIVAKNTQIKLDYTTCQRIKLTPPQASLPLKERIKNICGVFNCTQNLQGLNIALVDDVMTTGASLNELAKTLKKAGAAHVECWVIARTLPK
ncbi:MAG TPA: ComF family protein [Methylotenera sp.]|nr:ComF family protein [Methylotenera sp.]